jgi:hypothetical protein
VPEHEGGQDGEQHRGRGQGRPQPRPAQLGDPVFQHFIDDLGHAVIEHVAEPVEKFVGRRGGEGRHSNHHKSAKRGLQGFFCRKISAIMLGSPHGDDAAQDHR